MRKYFGFVGMLLLSGCGVPSNPEYGPVVVLCEGEEVNGGANGEAIRQHKRKFYQINGLDHTLKIWDDETQTFGTVSTGLTASPTEFRYSRVNPILAGLSSSNTIIFDRVSGRVTDEFLMSNGGSIGFSALCKPVKSLVSERKF